MLYPYPSSTTNGRAFRLVSAARNLLANFERGERHQCGTIEGVYAMASHGTENGVPEVPADQLMLDQMLKRLRKLRWIGRELEAQVMLKALPRSKGMVPRIPDHGLTPQTGPRFVLPKTTTYRSQQDAMRNHHKKLFRE
jgi:hypothetical protein